MMLRMVTTLAVGFGLLVGLGAFFDPEGAREALRRDLSGLADAAVRQAEEAVRGAVQHAGRAAPKGSTGEPKAGPREPKRPRPVVAGRAATGETPGQTAQASPGEGPGEAAQASPGEGPGEGAEASPGEGPGEGARPRAGGGPARSAEAVEVVEVAARAEFVEAPLPAPPAPPLVTSPGSAARGVEREPRTAGSGSEDPAAARDAGPAPALEAADVAAQGTLIRRMLALYRRVSESR